MTKLKRGVPASMFVDELVRVTTNLPVPNVESEDEEMIPAMAITGMLLDSDDVYLTLGGITPEGLPVVKMAVKHEDVVSIELFDPDEDNDSLQKTDGTIN